MLQSGMFKSTHLSVLLPSDEGRLPLGKVTATKASRELCMARYAAPEGSTSCSRGKPCSRTYRMPTSPEQDKQQREKQGLVT